MNPNVILDGIVERIKADTGTGGLYVGSTYTIVTGGWWSIEGPSILPLGQRLPYGVINLSDIVPSNAFAGDGCEFVVEFTIFAAQSGGLSVISPALARLYGNAISQSGRLPTYGFHRLNQLPLSTDPTLNPMGLVGGPMQWIGSRTESPTDTTVIQTTTAFRGWASVPASNP